MLPVQARLLEAIRSIREGSNARLIVLRATQEGMANLLKQVPRQPAPPSQPTVLPARASPPGMPDAAMARQVERLFAGQTAALVTQAYVDAGARPAPRLDGASQRDGTVSPVAQPAAFQPDGQAPFIDPRAVSLPGNLQPLEGDDEDELQPASRRRRALAISQSGREGNDASPLIDRRVVFLAVGGLVASLLAGLLKALF